MNKPNPNALVILGRYSDITKARIYHKRLEAHGMTVSFENEHMGVLFPGAEGHVILRIKVKDYAEASKLLEKFESDMLVMKQEDDYKNASMEDILYEKEVYEADQKLNVNSGLIISLIFALLFILIFVFVIYPEIS